MGYSKFVLILHKTHNITKEPRIDANYKDFKKQKNAYSCIDKEKRIQENKDKSVQKEDKK